MLNKDHTTQMKKIGANRKAMSMLFLGVGIGAALGASLGILFAPDKGSETRKKHAAVRKQVVGIVKSKLSDIAQQVSAS